jgi:hypothetical protein
MPDQPSRLEELAVEAGIDPDWLRWHLWEAVADAELKAREAHAARLREIAAAGLVETLPEAA